MSNNKKNNKKVDIKYIGVPNICFSLTEKDDKREIRFRKQRIERGFDDSETWSLDSTIIKFILPRLKVFREKHVGYPASLTEEKWNKILDKMIDGFEIMNRQFDHSLTDEDWKKAHKGLNLFRKWFFNLWD